jgi:hypothetical protein
MHVITRDVLRGGKHGSLFRQARGRSSTQANQAPTYSSMLSEVPNSGDIFKVPMSLSEYFKPFTDTNTKQLHFHKQFQSFHMFLYLFSQV